MNPFRKLVWIGFIFAVSITALSSSGAAGKGEKYVIVAWNNLGMHCYDGDFSVFAILPPFNTLFAQVVKVGDPPQVITDGITLNYGFPENTYSAGRRGRPDKTNFWDYAQQLFRLQAPLPLDVGLTGLGLAGVMSPVGTNHFEAAGIPLTEFRDQDAVNLKPYSYQLARITMNKTGAPDLPDSVLANLTVVAPVSSEFDCFTCHADDADATTKYPITPTGNVKRNILAIHDYLNPGVQPPLSGRPPFLCADCHGSNALGMPGEPGTASLSNAMHGRHNPDNVPDITPDTTEGCYNCHPGAITQCLRDTMTEHFSLNCTNCHGNMADVAANPNPWLIEPRCESCHGGAYAPDQALYRESRGHGGIYCAGCHDSPHTYAPSREANDGIKFKQLQGHAGPLRDCTVCHLTRPANMFNHMGNSTVRRDSKPLTSTTRAARVRAR